MKKRSEVGGKRTRIKGVDGAMPAKDFAKGGRIKGASAVAVHLDEALDWVSVATEEDVAAAATSVARANMAIDARMAADGIPVWERNMNAEQLEAIRHHEGPVAVLAQAGSGKTRALVHRIARMVAEGVAAEEILAVTFSKKAADEMNERLRKLDVSDARVGTWHSLCLQIIKEDATVWSDWEIDEKNVHKRIVKDVLGYKHLDWKKADLGKVMQYIGLCKANLYAKGSPEAMELAKARFGSFAMKLASDAYEISQNMLEERGLLTFDDMLVFVARHLSVEENRQRWANRWTFLLQDEAQDQNVAQKTIAWLLARDHRNYMVVGDVAQSIYAFRGSAPKLLMDFITEWGARTIEMNRNYRSGDAIVAAANNIIRPATLRLPSDMIAERGVPGSVAVRASVNHDDEARNFVEWAKDLLAKGAKLADITALFRTNAQSRALEEALLGAKLPYVVVGGTSFYERKEVKDLLAYLRVAMGGDEESVKRSINTPFRFLGAAFVERVMSHADVGADWADVVTEVANHAGVQARQRASAQEWARIVLDLRERIGRGERPETLLSDVVNRTQYIAFLEKDEGEESIESSHSANVREMIRVASRFDTTADLLSFIEQNLRAARRQRDDKQAGGERILLMSIHRSKGLEWPHLFVSGMNEAVLPHIKGDVEEERRLAYVAATRARDTLVLSYVREIATRAGIKDAAPSRFLADLMPVDVEAPTVPATTAVAS